MGEPFFNVAFTSDVVDIFHVNDHLASKGWRMNGLQRPPALHFCVTRPNTQPGVAEAFAADLRDAVEYAKNPPRPMPRSGAMYGAGGTEPPRERIVSGLLAYLDAVHEVGPGCRDVTPDEFRANGRLLVDWIARYLEEVGDYPVLSQVQPGDIRATLPTSPPSAPEPFTAVLDDIDGVIMPGITHWQSPNFFAYFPANRSPVSILGELLSAGLGVQGMSWATSPSATELETHVLDWMVELLDLPAVFVGNGVIQDSASSATLCAILAARDRARAAGASIETLVGYASSQAHSSIEKGLRIAGIPADRFRKVDTDDAFAMRPEALAAAIAADRANGLVPFFVCAAAGATSTLAFDPVPEIAAITKAAITRLGASGCMSTPR